MSWLKLAIAAVVFVGFCVGVYFFEKKDNREIEEEYAAYREYIHHCLHND